MVSVLFVAGFIISVFYVKDLSPNSDDRKLRELQGLVLSLPTPSSFIKIDETASSRHMDAGVYLYYLSNESKESVWEFYRNALSAKGWRERAGSGDLSFTRLDTTISVQYRAPPAGWNVAVSAVWQSPGSFAVTVPER